MKRLVLSLIAMVVLAAPAGASADLTITNLHRDAATDQDSQAGLIWFDWTKPTSALTSYNVYVDGALWWDHPAASATQEWVGSYSWPCGASHVIGIEAVDGSTVGPRATQSMTNKACAPPPPSSPCGGSGATWCDEFNGSADSSPDASKWQVSTRCENDSAATNYCLNAANARHDGLGNMVLKVTTGTKGRRFDGVDIATFAEGTGWPPAYTLASVRPHTWFEARMKFGGVVGDWAAQWPESVNPSFIELDVGENRLAVPNESGFHVHGPLNADRGCTADIRQWHTYAANYYANRVTFYLDDVACGTTVAFPSGFTAPAVGMQLEAKVANDNSWGSNFQPVAPHPASEDVLTIDYVRAWQY